MNMDEITIAKGLVSAKMLFVVGFLDLMSKSFPLVSNYFLLRRVRGKLLSAGLSTDYQENGLSDQEPALTPLNAVGSMLFLIFVLV